MASLQMYFIELFIDKITVFLAEDESDGNLSKNMVFKINFGPKAVFIIQEGQLLPSQKDEKKKDDIIECDEDGKRKWSRTIRIGKSYMFPSYPDTVINTFSKFTIEVEVWDDDDTDDYNIYVGTGQMPWDKEFYEYLYDSSDAKKIQLPFAVKSKAVLKAECCCRICGEVTFILRVTALGDSVITEFQPIPTDPDFFVFRTNKSPNMLRCTRVEGDDPNFCIVGSIYETATLEDPEVVAQASKKIKVCSELESCGVKGIPGVDYRCKSALDDQPKEYSLKTIKMGEILGPCGNPNCPVVRKVKNYIRKLDVYKSATKDKEIKTKEPDPKSKVCGPSECVCLDEKYHRETCPTVTGIPVNANNPEHVCKTKESTFAGIGRPICDKTDNKAKTCEDADNASKPTGAPSQGLSPKGSSPKGPSPKGSSPKESSPKESSPKGSSKASSPKNTPSPKQSPTNINYLTGISYDKPGFMKSPFHPNFIGCNFKKKSSLGNIVKKTKSDQLSDHSKT